MAGPHSQLTEPLEPDGPWKTSTNPLSIAAGVEASVIGPANAPQAAMAQAARKKLEYVLRKK